MINRRQFIYSSLIGLVGSQIPFNPSPFNYIPHPAQIAFMNSPDRVLYMMGGYAGGGKTVTMEWHRKAIINELLSKSKS